MRTKSRLYLAEAVITHTPPYIIRLGQSRN